jgi:hypothetical protein
MTDVLRVLLSRMRHERGGGQQGGRADKQPTGQHLRWESVMPSAVPDSAFEAAIASFTAAREQAEKRADEAQQRADRAEARTDELREKLDKLLHDQKAADAVAVEALMKAEVLFGVEKKPFGCRLTPKAPPILSNGQAELFCASVG